MEILQLLKANIRNKKGAFKSIIALMTIIVIAFTTIISNTDNIGQSLLEAHKWSGTTEMTAFFSAPDLDNEMLEDIKENSNVDDVTTMKCVLGNSGHLNGQEMSSTNYFYSDKEKFYRVFNENITGYVENPEPLREGEIYIAYTCKVLYDSVEIGSNITIEIPTNDPKINNTYKFKVKGFIADPNFGGAAVGTKRCIVSNLDFEKMYKNASEWFTCVEADINLNDNAEYFLVKNSLDDSCDFSEKASFVVSDMESITYTKLYSETTSGIIIAFVILLIIITIITMYHSITTSVEMEYVNLGVLKSQGFTTGKIRLLYILQYVFAEIIGVAIGLVLSFPVIILLGTIYQNITGVIAIHNISFITCLLLSIMIIAISAFFVVIATLKVSKISPVRAISGGKSEVHFNSRFNVPIKGRPLSFFMSLRQFTSRGKSYMGVVLVFALLVYFMMSIMVLSDRLSGSEIVTGTISPNLIVMPSEKFKFSDMEKIEKTVHKVDDNAKVIFNSTEYLVVNGMELICEGATPSELMYQPLDGRLPLYDNEIAITEIVSEEMGKKIGDTVTVSYGEIKKDFIITGYYQSLSDFGRTFTLTAEGFYEVTEALPNCYIELSNESLATKVSEELDNQCKELIERKIIEKDRNASADGMVEMIDGICTVLVIAVFIIAILFSVVVINMICSKAFIKERMDIGVFKSLGFTADKLRKQFAFRFLLIAVVGSLVGGVMSLFLTSPLLQVLTKIIGLTRIEMIITPTTFIIPTVAICASFFLFAYIVARKIKSVEVRELITE